MEKPHSTSGSTAPSFWKSKTWSTTRDLLVITVGLLVYTLGWTCFLIPEGISGGGASGIGTLVYFVTGIPVGVTFLAVNAILIFIAIKTVGASFGFKTIYGVVLASIMLAIEQRFITVSILPDDKLLSAIIGGVMSGLGIAIALSRGGSTGGTDIVAIIVTKYRNVSPGRVVLCTDVFIITAGFFVLTDLSWLDRLRTVMYGYILMVATAYVIDVYLSGLKQSLQVFIFTRHYEPIADRITQELGRGVTLVHGTGWFSKQEGAFLLVLLRKTQVSALSRIVKQEDPEAFMSMANVQGVYGRGFDVIRP